MKKILRVFFTILLIFCYVSPVLSEVITGNIEKSEAKKQNRIVDADTKKPIPFATIKIPTKKFQTKSDEDGFFKLNADINGTTIMSVEKRVTDHSL